jgi:hypothetical protein
MLSSDAFNLLACNSNFLQQKNISSFVMCHRYTILVVVVNGSSFLIACCRHLQHLTDHFLLDPEPTAFKLVSEILLAFVILSFF